MAARETRAAASTKHAWDADYNTESQQALSDSQAESLINHTSTISKHLVTSEAFWNMLLERNVLKQALINEIKQSRKSKSRQVLTILHTLEESKVYQLHGFIYTLVNTRQQHLAQMLGYNPAEYLDTELFMRTSSFSCPSCKAVDTVDVYIMTGCGHYLCGPCLKRSKYTTKDDKKENIMCPVDGCGQVTEASPAKGKLGVDMDVNYQRLCQSLEHVITQDQPNVIAEDIPSDVEYFANIGVELLSTQEKLQKYKDAVERGETEFINYITQTQTTIEEKIDKWANTNIDNYQEIKKQVSNRRHQSIQWGKAASDLSWLIQTHPGLDQILEVPDLTLPPAAEQLINSLVTGGDMEEVISPVPYIPRHQGPLTKEGEVKQCVEAVVMPPPTQGRLVQQIDLASSDYAIHDLCWTSDGHLLVARVDQLLKVELEQSTMRCKQISQLIQVERCCRVASGNNGMWAAGGNNKKIINIHTPGKEVEKWTPREVKDPWAVCLCNDEIYVGDYGSMVSGCHSGRVEVYGCDDREWRRSITIKEPPNNKISHLTISPHGHVIASTGDDGHLVHTLDVSTGSLVSVGEYGEFFQPTGVATDHQGNILVCNSCNNQVSVLGPSGEFLHQLSLDQGSVQPRGISVMERPGRPPLMAVGGTEEKIRIYELT